MAANFFCVDFSETTIKIADVNNHNNILDAISLGFADSEPAYFTTDSEKNINNQKDILTKLIDKLKIVKKNVGIIIPDTYTYSQILEMPKLNEKELISAIKYQADQLIPMPIEKVNIDIEIIREDEKEKKLMVLMVAAPKTLIEKVQNTVESVGLIPEFIENELSSTSRLMTYLMSNQAGKQLNNNFILLNFNLHSSSLYFYNSHFNVISQIYNFNIGLDLFLREIQVNLNIDNKKSLDVLSKYELSHDTSYPIEKIIEPVIKEFNYELIRFVNLVYQKYQLAVNSFYLFNDCVKFPALSKIIEKQFNAPTSMINTYNNFKKSNLVESYKNELPIFASTVGGNLR